jgi:beta-lactamase superfamily II metal-dependent hydrolase
MAATKADATGRRPVGRRSKPTGAPAAAPRKRIMTAPKSGVKVRMYRQGHGDCFLLAFRGKRGKPVYVLIDCGYKPGSNGSCYNLKEIDDVVDDIKASTEEHLHLVVVTHEHQDHVNGFWRKGTAPFQSFDIGAAWFAWTEDPHDDLANELRRRHRDQLLGLVAARNRLAADGKDEVDWLDDLLTLELGLDLEEGQSRSSQFKAAATKKNLENSVNKQGMKLIKEKVGEKRNIQYIKPHEGILEIPGVEGVRVFALGPPYDAGLIADEDPKGSEAFPGEAFTRMSFFSVVERGGAPGQPNLSPFARRFTLPLDSVTDDKRYAEFFRKWYGYGTPESVDKVPCPNVSDAERQVRPGESWRRIDHDWLYSAEQLALALNRGVNNTSLVLAFELSKSKKVLLFVADAQRGNWISWTAGEWKDDDGDKKITARDLLARTVLYKVGHHGSHNATLS